MKSTGDGLLVEFASPVRAVLCAVAIQKGIESKQVGLPQDRILQLRIGINLGDVIADVDGDLYGDGVNVAARLEALSEPGGICISHAVYEQVRDKLPWNFESRSSQILKNISRPMDIFVLSASTIQSIDYNGRLQRKLLPRPKKSPLMIALMAGLLAILTLGAYLASAFIPNPKHTAAGLQATAPIAPALSMVVLPFKTLSNDPDQDFFADALTEDLTTDLARIKDNFVVARNTAFVYKGRTVDAKQIGRDLGVRFILEGSVRRTGASVIVNAQLVSAEDGGHVWADRFEGALTRLNELQGEFVARLARSLNIVLTNAATTNRSFNQGSPPGAFDLALKGWSIANKATNKANNDAAMENFKQAVAADPDLPKALVGLALCHIRNVVNVWSKDPDNETELADALISKALGIEPDNAWAHYVKALVYRARGLPDRSALELEASFRLDPSFAPAYVQLGQAIMRMGQADKVPEYIEKALRLSPFDPNRSIWLFVLGSAYAYSGDNEAAVRALYRSIQADPDYQNTYALLTAAMYRLGRLDEARSSLAHLLALSPDYSINKFRRFAVSNNMTFNQQVERIVEALRAAGLKES
ncbi:adenylate/guanylate cyclase domain-containing protein [Alsobacter sp. SYSU BS001988]